MKVGLIGTGLMGLPMAQRLLNAEIPLIAYNRTETKLEPLKAGGAAIATSPQEVIHNSDCVVLMLSDAAAVRSVLLSEESRPTLSGCTIIQMSTIAASESKAIHEEVVAAGGDYLEAPVLGSIPQAEAGELIVMVGSSPEQFEQWTGILKNFGPEPLLIGPVGTASALKLALNQLISSLTTAFSLSLGLVMRHGIDPEVFMKILRESALYAPTFDKKLSRMVERDFTNPNFPAKHMLKDTNLFATEAKAAGLNISSVEGVQKILETTLAMNHAEDDYSALFAAVNPPEP